MELKQCPYCEGGSVYVEHWPMEPAATPGERSYTCTLCNGLGLVESLPDEETLEETVIEIQRQILDETEKEVLLRDKVRNLESVLRRTQSQLIDRRKENQYVLEKEGW